MAKSTLTSHSSARHGDPGDAIKRTCGRGAVGFTLMELLVSLAIMAIIMLAFGGLLNQANRIVTQGEKRMRSDAAAAAISRVIRNDIRQITKNGFLRLGQIKVKDADEASGSEATYRQILVFTTAGKVQSAFGDKTSDGSVIMYGRNRNTTTGEEDDPSALYRKVTILARDDTAKDCLTSDMPDINNLADLQVLSDKKMSDLLDDLDDEPKGMKYPPETLAQVTNTSWMVLTGGCKKLDIQYRKPGKDKWETEDGLVTHTRHDQTSWPTALKFRFTLSSESLVGSAIIDGDDATDDVIYEIICPIGH
jgi:prepilin-type N-terminal cleavage/methylation domain-containing protein